MTTDFFLDGRAVSVPDDEWSLLDALREHLGVRTAKDGCSPQGQCGCCTVWVDGSPRVACVTPVRRVAGREVTTVDGLPGDVARRWADAFVGSGASQCGFCTPGIVMRLAALEHRPGGRPVDEGVVRQSLAAHLCRCTGWQTIVEAAGAVLGVPVGPQSSPPQAATPQSAASSRRASAPRDPLLGAWRAQLEGPAFQMSTVDSVLGRLPFADDATPSDALPAAAPAPDGSLVLAPTLAAARRQTGKIQGRRSTIPLRHPLAVPEGDWAVALATTWVEPAYLEPDASWCMPGGRPASPLANGGAFGGKRRSPVVEAARDLAERERRPVRVVWSREDVVRRGPKRPPLALGVRPDGTGVARVARTPGSSGTETVLDRIAAAAPGLRTEVVDVAGPPTSADVRGAGWVEVTAALAVLGMSRGGRPEPGTPVEVTGPSGGRARVAVTPGRVGVEVWAGEVLDEVVLRSYCLGAVHQALGWVRSEGVAVDGEGEVHDLTIRSFGVLAARDTPWVDVTVHPEDRWPVNGSDAVLAATAAAAWIADGLPPTWPTRRGVTPASGA